MNIKKEYLILGALIVILSTYLIFRNQNRSFYDLPKIPSINKEDITKIEISEQGSSTSLTKKNNEWYILPDNYLADENKINNILNTIDNLSLTALVSESKNYTIYDLGDDKKITVKAWSSDGKLQREFDIGKTAKSYRHTHIKLPNDYRVYHASTNIRPKFDQTMENLRDKIVLSFEKNEIKEILFITKGKIQKFIKKVFEKKDAKDASSEPDKPAKLSQPIWEYIGKGNVDQKKLENLLDIVSKLKCEKYIYNKQKEDYRYPDLTLILKGNEEYILSVFSNKDKKDKNQPCISSGSDQPFEIPDYQAKHFMESLLTK